MPDDDDLLSLDFTLPGMLPPAAPEPPPQPAAKVELSLVDVDAPSVAPAASPAVPAKPVRPEFPAALREAAQMLEHGDALGASRRLESALKTGERLGEYAQRTWLALTDVLQILGRQDVFDKLGLAYATRFETSPPPWRTPRVKVAKAALNAGGFALPETVDAGCGNVLKEMLKVAGAHPVLTVDLGSVKQIDDAGCTLLLRAVDAVNKAGRYLELRNAEAFVRLLRDQLEVGAKTHEPVWLALLEVLHRGGNQEVFEEEAVNYAVSFEVSPPSWNPPRPPADAAPPEPEPVATTDEFASDAQLDGEILGYGADQFSKLLAVGGEGVAEIDAGDLTRIDAASVEALKSALGEFAQGGHAARISGLPQLPYITLVQAQVDTLAELQLRKY